MRAPRLIHEMLLLSLWLDCTKDNVNSAPQHVAVYHDFNIAVYHNVKLARDEMLPIPMLSLYWKAGQILTPAAPKSTCQTSLARWWKPTHVGGQDGTRSLLWVNRQLSCKEPVVGLNATYIKTVISKIARGEAPVLRLGPLHIDPMQTFSGLQI